MKRVCLDPADLRLLIRSGCFDTLEGIKRRPALQWEALAGYRQRKRADTLDLFDDGPMDIPDVPSYDEKTVLNQEIDTLGMLASRHPLTIYHATLKRVKTLPAVRIGENVGRTVTMAGWWITGKTVSTKHGEPMEFVTFEDTTATFETTFFPRTYARFCRKMNRNHPYLLRGKVEEEFGVATLNVEWIGTIDNGK